MITLFRRIREKLIASGSLTKYLLYAVGEILLVVIGILIALQVNNWNEERQKKDRRIELLGNIQADYLRNGSRLEEALKDSEGINSDYLRLMDLISNEIRSVPMDSLVLYLDNFPSITTFSSLNSSYLTAQSTGDIGLIKDKELLELFIEFQDDHDWLDFHVQLSGDMVYAGSIWDMRKRLGSMNVLQEETPDSDPFPDSFGLTDSELRAFLSEPEVFATIEGIYWVNRNVLKSIRSMQDVNRRILMKLEQMLDSGV